MHFLTAVRPAHAYNPPSGLDWQLTTYPNPSHLCLHVGAGRSAATKKTGGVTDPNVGGADGSHRWSATWSLQSRELRTGLRTTTEPSSRAPIRIVCLVEQVVSDRMQHVGEGAVCARHVVHPLALHRDAESLHDAIKLAP